MDNKYIKQLVIAASAGIIILAGSVWFFLQSDPEPQKEPITNTKDAAGAVTSADIGASANPAANKLPEVNPVDRANPFKDAYKNPFE